MNDDTNDNDKEAVNEYLAMIKSNDVDKQLRGLVCFRVLLSRDQPPLGKVVNSGAVPFLVRFLESPSRRFQFEAAWAICNIASGSVELTSSVVTAGAVPLLVRMVQAPDDELSGQAMWALGNIIGESPLWRDMCLELGVLEMLLDAIVDMPAEILVRVPLWLLSNLCRGRPLPDAEKMCRAFPLLAALTRVDLPEILIDTCWGLAHLSGNTSDRIQRMIDTGVVPRLIELVVSPVVALAVPALRCIGNCVSGSDAQTQTVIDAGGLAAVVTLLGSMSKSLRKDACWVLSNVASGADSQVQAFLECGAVPILVEMMRDELPAVRKEVCWALANATRSHVAHIQVLVDHNVVEALASMVFETDSKILTVALEGLDNIIRMCEARELPIAHRLDDAWIERLGVLRVASIEDVSWRADTLLALVNGVKAGLVKEGAQEAPPLNNE
jgi:importin subunit alpha-1